MQSFHDGDYGETIENEMVAQNVEFKDKSIENIKDILKDHVP